MTEQKKVAAKKAPAAKRTTRGAAKKTAPSRVTITETNTVTREFDIAAIEQRVEAFRGDQPWATPGSIHFARYFEQWWEVIRTVPETDEPIILNDTTSYPEFARLIERAVFTYDRYFKFEQPDGMRAIGLKTMIGPVVLIQRREKNGVGVFSLMTPDDALVRFVTGSNLSTREFRFDLDRLHALFGDPMRHLFSHGDESVQINFGRRLIELHSALRDASDKGWIPHFLGGNPQ
ncbi:hypothetical protein [Paraburkholderia sp. BCC1886]|uniref:hypothetical protein n=1 Tax=Paraburkholderia sp. BCC1886 TaxID=2562670 RepID=UPI00118291E0|nr:hypothetical protein [Paraburkholderia sp. BCC1886]